MADLEAALAQVRSAWMAGRSALEYCPLDWRGAIDGGDGECALVALAGHAATVLFRPAPSASIAPRPLLPKLALPTVPESVRPRLRRILAAQKTGASLEQPLIDLVAARGFAMHPADWMPSPRDEWAPDLYAPWLDWARAEGGTAPAEVLTVETYDRWSWAERRVELAGMRQRDPAAARAIIAGKAAAEPADRRVRLIELLATNLSEADAEFLDSLATDRSERVQALARALLARLGRHADTDALAKELAEMLELGKVGLLRRRVHLTIKTLKTAPQTARRRELFKQVGFADLARALGTSEEQLLETAPSGVEDGVEAFVQMVADTGSDTARRLLLVRMLEDDNFPLIHARPLAPRLTAEERRSILPRVMQRDNELFEATLALMGRTLGEAPMSALLASTGYGQLTNIVKAALGGDDTQRTPATRALEQALSRVALLVDRGAATELIARLTGWGLSPADPKLDLLRLNAALTPETTS